MLTWESIERAFEGLLTRLHADERLEGEFRQSRAEFFTDGLAARAPLAERRHLEWFLLERPSVALGAIPARAWQEDLQGSLAEAPGDLPAALLHSLPGAFEVSSLVPGEGLWVRDLFTLGEHPVAEVRATAAMQVGDLLVGRLFPAGGGTHLLSPAVAVFRNPELLAAVRSDLATMRAARRGVLRVQQLELEHLFHGPGAVAPMPSSLEESRAQARTGLVELGVPAARAAALLAEVHQAARTGDGKSITELLNRLAFETDIDLAAARLLLVALWDDERAHTAPVEPRDVPERDAHAALEAFDRGRAAGADLEQLFKQLEHDLGVETESDEDEDPGAPDFPGVVGAMVEEFLWDTEREQGPASAQRYSPLRLLGSYGRDIGVFDELGHAHLLDFSARWLLDEGGLHSAEQVEVLLEALAAFCAWTEERHALPLHTLFGATLQSLRASLPRHLALRQQAEAGLGHGAYQVLRVESRQAVVSDGKGSERAVELTPAQAAHLRDGDLVRLSQRAGAPVLGAAYPAELAAFLL